MHYCPIFSWLSCSFFKSGPWFLWHLTFVSNWYFPHLKTIFIIYWFLIFQFRWIYSWPSLEMASISKWTGRRAIFYIIFCIRVIGLLLLAVGFFFYICVFFPSVTFGPCWPKKLEKQTEFLCILQELSAWKGGETITAVSKRDRKAELNYNSSHSSINPSAHTSRGTKAANRETSLHWRVHTLPGVDCCNRGLLEVRT